MILHLAVFLNAEHRLAEIVRVRHVVTVEDTSRLVTSDSHGDGLIDPAGNQIPGSGAPEVVEEPVADGKLAKAIQLQRESIRAQMIE